MKASRKLQYLFVDPLRDFYSNNIKSPIKGGYDTVTDHLSTVTNQVSVMARAIFNLPISLFLGAKERIWSVIKDLRISSSSGSDTQVKSVSKNSSDIDSSDISSVTDLQMPSDPEDEVITSEEAFNDALNPQFNSSTTLKVNGFTSNLLDNSNLANTFSLSPIPPDDIVFSDDIVSESGWNYEEFSDAIELPDEPIGSDHSENDTKLKNEIELERKLEKELGEDSDIDERQSVLSATEDEKDLKELEKELRFDLVRTGVDQKENNYLEKDLLKNDHEDFIDNCNVALQTLLLSHEDLGEAFLPKGMTTNVPIFSSVFITPELESFTYSQSSDASGKLTEAKVLLKYTKPEMGIIQMTSKKDDNIMYNITFDRKDVMIHFNASENDKMTVSFSSLDGESKSPIRVTGEISNFNEWAKIVFGKTVGHAVKALNISSYALNGELNEIHLFSDRTVKLKGQIDNNRVISTIKTALDTFKLFKKNSPSLEDILYNKSLGPIGYYSNLLDSIDWKATSNKE